MKTIRCTDTLFYYDGPQILEARDAIGGHYLVVMATADDGRDRCLAVGVAPERLRQFRAGALELRSLMVEAGREEWYLATATNLDQPLEIEPQQTPLAESHHLPDDGFVLPDHHEEGLVLREARDRNNVMLEITVTTREANPEPRIRLDTYAELLHHFQTMAKHAWRAASRELSHRDRSRMDAAGDHLMDVVVPAAAGSFRVVLEAAGRPGTLRKSALSCTLQRMDLLFENAASPRDALVSLREHHGNLANAYVRFLQLLVKHGAGFRYSWAEPTSIVPNCREIMESEAGSLVEVLSGKSHLHSERVTLAGTFENFNRKKGTWGLLIDGATVSGRVRGDGMKLDNLVVGGQYRFSCVQETEEVESTGRKSRTLYLINYESLSE